MPSHGGIVGKLGVLAGKHVSFMIAFPHGGIENVESSYVLLVCIELTIMLCRQNLSAHE